MKVKIIITALCTFMLTACTTLEPDSLSSAGESRSQIDPASKGMGLSGRQEFTYTAEDGQIYDIVFVWDGLLRGYGTEITRPGAPLSSNSTDDVLVQNTLRDFFNREICSQGYFAGITNSYGALDNKPGTWGAKVKCTTKHQANV